MQIIDVIDILRAERILGRTPSGRRITEYGKDILDAAIEDKKNWNAEVQKCLNCGFVGSGLLFPEGCGVCGSKDLTSEINYADILQKEII